jgi:sigma-B regulation protein RsbU (phosphoserine phosphatase)
LDEAVARVKQENTSETFKLEADDLPSITGYESQLTELFFRLLENSVKFRSTERDLVIRIRCTSVQENIFRVTEGNYRYIDFLKIVYTDNGIGFDNRYNEYIFQILKRIENKGTGLGFGLAFCKKIVQNHGGTISASSNGKGATFTILLQEDLLHNN